MQKWPLSSRIILENNLDRNSYEMNRDRATEIVMNAHQKSGIPNM